MRAALRFQVKGTDPSRNMAQLFVLVDPNSLFQSSATMQIRGSVLKIERTVLWERGCDIGSSLDSHFPNVVSGNPMHTTWYLTPAITQVNISSPTKHIFQVFNNHGIVECYCEHH